MALARYFVFPPDRNWVVALDGMPIARHRSEPQALSSAIVMADLMGAMQHDADVMLDADGELRVAWTYGVDPLPEAGAAAA